MGLAILEHEPVASGVELLETLARRAQSDAGPLGTGPGRRQPRAVVRDLEAMLQEFTEAGRVARENAPLGNLVSFTALFFSILN